MDEEARPYMPALQPHVIEGVALPTTMDEQAEEQKIIADIGPQTHPVPKPETAHQAPPVADHGLTMIDESAIESRTPSPPLIRSSDTLSPDSANGAPLIREPPNTIEQDISTATQETIIPTVDQVTPQSPIDLNIDLENISSMAPATLPIEEQDCSTPRATIPPPSDNSDTLSISSTSSSQAPSEPFEPVIGDYLKMQFMNHRVISTILELFFKFPWNNFLHNVVYDVVQQVFNGPMDRGYNRVLAIDVFAQGQLCEKIVAGQKASDDHVTGDGVRLGYMGHLTLIAEEVVKFVERYPPHQMSSLIAEKVNSEEWIDYVENTLAATRARDSAVLGGERPQAAQPQQPQMAASMGWDMDERSYDVDEDDEELQRRMGQFAIQEESETSDQFANYISQQISNDVPDKFGSSDEEDEDDDQELSEWMNDRGDFLRTRSFDRFEDADDEQVESLDEPEMEESDELQTPASRTSVNRQGEDLSGAHKMPGYAHDVTDARHSDGEEDEETERAPTPEGGPLPQSASPAPNRRSLEDEGDDA